MPPPANGAGKLDRLKQLISESKKEEEANAVVTVDTPATPEVTYSEPVTQSTFANVWSQFLNQLEQERKMSLSVIYKNATWQLLNDQTVELTLASQHEREMFEEDRINIIPFLRSRLKNSGFELLIKVNVSIVKSRVFTAEERFKVMAEKNPMLNDLRHIFGLELE